MGHLIPINEISSTDSIICLDCDPMHGLTHPVEGCQALKLGVSAKDSFIYISAIGAQRPSWDLLDVWAQKRTPGQVEDEAVEAAAQVMVKLRLGAAWGPG